MSNAADQNQSLDAIEGGLRNLLYSTDTRYMSDVERQAQDIYRRLVRGNVFKVVRMAIPIARKLLGEVETDRLIARWLDDTPPQSRLLRLLPEEFAAWVTEQEDLPHPALAELVHWETLEVGILHAVNDTESHPQHPTPAGYIVAASSTRLCSFSYPVHRMTLTSTWPDALANPVIVLGFRAAERLDWVELPTAVGQCIVLVAQGQTLADAGEAIGAALGAVPDAAFVRSWLIDLRARGALLGFPTEIVDAD